MTCCQACPERNIQYNRTASLCAMAVYDSVGFVKALFWVFGRKKSMG
jgi:hypothetical protein